MVFFFSPGEFAKKEVTEEGFEPSPPKRLVPETSALDRSAIQPKAMRRHVRRSRRPHKNENAASKKELTEEGFEPSPPKRLVPETSALDRSAIQPKALLRRRRPPRFVCRTHTKSKCKMRRPGIKPGSRPWQGRILSLYYRRTIFVLRFERRISRVLGERHNQARPYEHIWSIWVSIPVPRAC